MVVDCCFLLIHNVVYLTNTTETACCGVRHLSNTTAIAICSIFHWSRRKKLPMESAQHDGYGSTPVTENFREIKIHEPQLS